MTEPAVAFAVASDAGANVRQVLATFMRLRRVTQEQVGTELGLSQRQMSRRLNVPNAISAEELGHLAVAFGVDPGAFYKPEREAVVDLFSGSGGTLNRLTPDPRTPQEQPTRSSRCNALGDPTNVFDLLERRRTPERPRQSGRKLA